MLKKIPLLALSMAVAVMSACGGDSKHNPTGPGGVGGDNNGGNGGDNGNDGGNASAVFQATVTGNGGETLRGSAEFGAATSDAGAQAFTVVLRAQEGAIVFVRPDGTGTPRTGDYALSDATGDEVQSGEFYAAALEGSLAQPSAVLYSRGGSLHITSASDRRLRGEFEFDAVGTLPDDPETLVEVSVRGTFDAAPGSSAAARITSRRVLTHRARP